VPSYTPATNQNGYAERFAIERLLGRGAQGTVHLAFDKRLKREVAIKRIAKGVDGHGLSREAHAVSRLQHPNIVSLHDAFSEPDSDVLIFEFVEGESLSAYIRRIRGKTSINDGLRLISALLDGLHYAHQSGVVHCDVKPANVILDKSGVPRLTDFGIAAEIGSKPDGTPCTGTPSYLAPEIANGMAPSPKSDVFAAGVVLYELLTGAPPIIGSSVFEVIHRMATETYTPPSQKNAAIDSRLEQIILRAIAKRPEDRFPTAKAFADAIAGYMNGDAQEEHSPSSEKDVGNATIDFLLQRMRIKGDFPALGEAISAINRIAASETESVSTLTAVILKDVSLTNKLLRMVNTVCYKRFGGSISTISRAVAILGFDAVRNSALSLILFEHLKHTEQGGELRRMMAKSYFASEIARDLSGHLREATPEEGSIAAMFFDLGRLLVTFYLFEEAQQITRRAVQLSTSEDKAAREVIGISYAGLGVAVARRWGFPDKLVDALARTDGANDAKAAKGALGAVADCSNALTQCDTPEDFEGVARKFRDTLGIPANRLQSIRETCLERTAADASQIGLNLKELTASTATPPRATTSAAAGSATPATAGRPGNAALADDGTGACVGVEGTTAAEQAQQATQRQSLLVAGISDISQTLAGDFELLQVMRIIVETLYRGSSFKRVLLFTKDGAGTKVVCRIGFGAGSEKFVSERFAISLSPSRDVFYGCLSRNADLLMADTGAAKIAPYLPDWFRREFASQSALLLPITAQKKVLGLLYADSVDSKIAELQPSEMELLRTLRSQAVLAMKQKGVS
jgi:serine/threonine protein kinase